MRTYRSSLISMIRLILATTNRHKAAEIQQILGKGYSFATLHDFPPHPAVAEDQNSFAGNATKKAVALATRVAANPVAYRHFCPTLSQVFALADDSGLEVDVLEGAPGVLSARFASGQIVSSPSNREQDQANNAKLLHLLQNVPMERRTARFRCVLALTPVLALKETLRSPVCAASESEILTQLFEGSCEGAIGWTPKGQGGFGYDPLFIPENHRESLAELGEERKNRMSHRAKALGKLRVYLKTALKPEA